MTTDFNKPDQVADLPILLYVVNVDWFFLSHRLPLALAAREAGCDVCVAAADTGVADVIRERGFRFVRIPFSRHGLNPVPELQTLFSLIHLYKSLRPDLVHHVTIKPAIYGSAAARLTRVPAIVNAITGLGFSFGTSRGARMRKAIVSPLLRQALRQPRSRTIFQNPDDLAKFCETGFVVPEHARLIRSSGVNCSVFKPSPSPSPEGPPVVLLASRLVWAKGVREFVEAARMLRAGGVQARFVIAGAADIESPDAVPEETLLAWNEEGVVEWWGHRTDMPDVLAQSSVVVLPTMYRESVRKILIEDAASGRGIVASDAPGCREIVLDGVNGFLVPPGDSKALGHAIQELLQNRELRERFGNAGREIATKEFSVERVVEDTLEVYQELLGARWPGRGRGKREVA